MAPISNLYAKLSDKNSRLLTRIYNCRSQQFASGAVSQTANDCAAQYSPKLLTFGPKTCYVLTLFTNRVSCPMGQMMAIRRRKGQLLALIRGWGARWYPVESVSIKMQFALPNRRVSQMRGTLKEEGR